QHGGAAWVVALHDRGIPALAGEDEPPAGRSARTGDESWLGCTAPRRLPPANGPGLRARGCPARQRARRAHPRAPLVARPPGRVGWEEPIGPKYGAAPRHGTTARRIGT